MTPTNDPRTPSSRATPPADAARRKLMESGPESTITLMVERGQAPGNPMPGVADEPSAAPQGWWARLRAKLSAWF